MFDVEWLRFDAKIVTFLHVSIFFFLEPTMEPQTEKQRPPHGQLIFVPHKDTIRLLEVYVKRSLSLNDGSPGLKLSGKKEKWVTMAKKHRRSSSDPSLFLANGIKPGDSEVFGAVESLSEMPEKPPEDFEKSKKSKKKKKKPSFLKSLFSFFTRKNDEDSEEDPNDPAEVSVASEAVTTCLPTPPVTLQKKSSRKSSLKRKMSKRLSKRASKLLNPADITEVGGESDYYLYL